VNLFSVASRAGPQALYESAGKNRSATHISSEDKLELREAIIDLGNALRLAERLLVRRVHAPFCLFDGHEAAVFAGANVDIRLRRLAGRIR
jgi:hypothetical protein